MQAYYQFLTSLKILEKTKISNDEVDTDTLIKQLLSETKYWMADMKVQESSNHLMKMYWQIRRKLRV